MFVQYSFVERRYASTGSARVPFDTNGSTVFLTGILCMMLTAGAYILA